MSMRQFDKTGYAYGKIKIGGYVIIERDGGILDEFEANVFIHVKGYALSPENHIDIESKKVNDWIDEDWRGTATLYYEGDVIVIDVKTLTIGLILDDYRLFDECFDTDKIYQLSAGGKKGGMWIEIEISDCIDKTIERLYKIKPKR